MSTLEDDPVKGYPMLILSVLVGALTGIAVFTLAPDGLEFLAPLSAGLIVGLMANKVL